MAEHARAEAVTPTRRQLDAEEWLIDMGRRRRYCPEHPAQQMIPLLNGVARCPADEHRA